MKAITTIIFAVFLTSCSGPAIKSNVYSLKEFNSGEPLILKASIQEVAGRITKSIEDFGWVKLYSENKPPQKDSYMMANYDSKFSYESNFNHTFVTTLTTRDGKFWIQAMEGLDERSFFIHARTPISAFSYGTELFIVLSQESEKLTSVNIVAASQQWAEKNKMPGYIKDLMKSINIE